MSLPKGINKIIQEYCIFDRLYHEELIRKTRFIKAGMDIESEVYKDLGYRFDTSMYEDNYFYIERRKEGWIITFDNEMAIIAFKRFFRVKINVLSELSKSYILW